jgi:hypothetical protein
MFEHVGARRIADYFWRLRASLAPRGRLLNHAISAVGGSRFTRRTFVGRYVFPDGELIDVGDVVLAMERCGFEVRDVESLREHYVDTLSAWVAEHRGFLGQGGAAGRSGSCTRVAALHGCVGGQLRRRLDRGAPDAGRRARCAR